MALKIGNIATFILLGAAWVLLIVSYSTYWYKVTSTDGDVTYLSHSQYKVKYSNGNTLIGDLERHSYNKNLVDILRVTEAFAIIAWIVLCFTLLMIILSFVGILEKLPGPLALITKFLPLVALLFCLLSMFIFIGTGNALYRDCKSNSDNSNEFCKVQNHFIVNNGDYHQAPTTGWAVIVVATFLTLMGSVASLLLEQK